MNNSIRKQITFCLVLILVVSTFVVSAKIVQADSINVDGRLWAFSFAVPASETSLKINLGDWVNGSSGVSPGSNIQIYSPQSSNASDADSVITINNASAYSGKLDLVPGGGDDNVVRVIVQAYDFTDSNKTGTVGPTAEYVDAKGHTVTVQASSNVPIAAPVITTINIASTTANLTVGETQQLTAETLDQFGNPIDTDLSWASDNAGVATVDTTGLVTAVSVGTADITASSGSTTSNISVITVASSTEQPTSIEATSSNQTDEMPISTTTIITDPSSTASIEPTTYSTSTPVIDLIATSTDIQATSTEAETASTTVLIVPVTPPETVSSSTPAADQADAPISSSTPSAVTPVVPAAIPPPIVDSPAPVTTENVPSGTPAPGGNTDTNP